MKGAWWKFGSIALLLYVMVAGLGTPLRPALVHVTQDRISPGEARFIVTGYNTSFAKDPVAVWIENEGQNFCASSVKVLDDQRMEVVLEVPAGLRGPLTHLRAWNPSDGQLALFEAFYTVDIGSGAAEAPCLLPANAESVVPGGFPNRNILNETIRNLLFHVPMWFAMMVLMGASFVRSLQVLRTGDLAHDRDALSAVHVALLFAALGLLTGSVWARVTWNGWWTNDPKLNGSAVTVLIYAAYLVLRGSVPDGQKRARLAAVYNIFAFVLMLVFVMVIPRMNDSLHPGNGGNPAFSQYDLDDSLRRVFYPAVIGWIGLAWWIHRLNYRTARLQALADEANDR